MRLVRPILVTAAAIAYCFVFAEFFLRIMDPQPLLPRYVTGTELGIRGNVPNATYRHRTAEIDVEMRTNSQGMRADHDFAQTPEPGTCRIAILGDSYFMGYESDLPDSIAGQIEAQLGRAGYAVEVLNFGVSGFGTAEMLRLFEQRVATFDPDITVFQFHFSDFGDNVRSRLYRVSEGGSLTETGRSFLPGVKTRDRLMSFGLYRWLISNSHLYSAVREHAASSVKKLLAGFRTRKQPSPASGPSGGVGVPEGQLRLTSALIEATRRATNSAGSEWFLMDIPEARGRLHYFTRSGALELSKETRARIATPVDVFDAMKGPDVKLYFERGHWHLTPLGNRVATEVLVEKVLDMSEEVLRSCARA